MGEIDYWAGKYVKQKKETGSMKKPEVVQDESNNKVVLIPDIIFVNKQNINWNEVEVYLEKYIGESVIITDSGDTIYLGNAFPNEFAGSKYTRTAKGARAKAEANAVQGIKEIIEIATNKTFRKNHKEKHNSDAGNGWYYYTTRFALPIYDNDIKTNQYNVYTGCLVVNCTVGGKMYFDIKKEASNPFKTIM